MSGGGVGEEVEACGAVARWNNLRRGLDDAHVFVRMTADKLLLQGADGVALEGVLEGVDSKTGQLGGQLLSSHTLQVKR